MKSLPIAMVALFLVWSFPLNLQGNGVVTVSPAANELATAYNSQQKVVTAPDGTLFAVYTLQLDNGSYVIQVSRSNDEGASWKPLPNVPSAANSSRSSIAVDTKGIVHVVWAEGIPSYNKSKTYTTQIYYSTYAGVSWTPKVRLSDSRWYSGFPSIAIDSGGRIHVVWYGYDGEFYQIFYSSGNGTAWSTPVNISNLRQDSVNPTILSGNNGRLYVVWYALVSRYYQVWYSEYDGSWSISKALTSDPQDDLNPSAVLGPSGQLSVAWNSEVAGVQQVFHTSYDGISWSAEEQVTHSGAGSALPTQAFTTNGSLYIFWVSKGALEGCTYSKSCTPFVVYSEGITTYPSVESDSPAGHSLNLVWTNLAGGHYSVLFESMAVPSSGQAGLTLVLGAGGVAFAVAVIAVFLAHRRAARASRKS